MKVGEFSKRLGIPSTTVRYYDRIGLISGSRNEHNNYRDFDETDALRIYDAQMLRGFGMSVQESMNAKADYGLKDLSGWLEDHMKALQDQIRYEEYMLARLQQMNAYIGDVSRDNAAASYTDMSDSYNLWTFGSNLPVPDSDDIETARLLAERMPFSYVAVRISRESFLSGGPLDTSIGIGILAENMQKTGIKLPHQEKHYLKGGRVLTQMVQAEHLSDLSVNDFLPMTSYVSSNHLKIMSDLIGRLYISYRKETRIMHGLILGVKTADNR